jgi:hypothetical protein
MATLMYGEEILGNLYVWDWKIPRGELEVTVKIPIVFARNRTPEDQSADCHAT